MIFATERLTVRPWTDADLDRMFDLYRRWEVARWLGSAPKSMGTRDEAGTALERWNAANAAESIGGRWAVEVTSTGVVAGTLILMPLPDGHGEYEVGWHLHPDSWGRGYATESAHGALRHGFACGLDEVFAVVRTDNVASLAVCRRLDMTAMGQTRRYYDQELELFVSRRAG